MGGAFCEGDEAGGSGFALEVVARAELGTELGAELGAELEDGVAAGFAGAERWAGTERD